VAQAAASAAVAGTDKPVQRREFLNYVWGASMALFLAQFTGLSFFFALPRPRPGEFGGKITVNADEYKQALTDKAPIANNAGKFWIVNTDKGINALYKVCTHLGCIYPWQSASAIFACPCHGSQFQLDGTYIAGPAPRSLDRFAFVIHDASGAEIGKSNLDGSPVALPENAVRIVVDTGKKIEGESHF
jgi:cytochrome b6-f complex iron-sulfur subunit